MSHLHNCILHGNEGYDVDCQDHKSIYDPPDGVFDASCNYWGKATTAEMEAEGNPKDISAISDKFDDNRLWD